MPNLVSITNKLVATCPESEHKTEHFDIHYHNVYELYYFVEGDVDYLVEGKEYHLEPNSIMLLAPYVLHGIRINSTKKYKRFAIHFDASLLNIEHRSLLLAPFPNKAKRIEKEIYYTNIQDYSLYPFCEALIHCIEQKNNTARRLRPIYLEALLAQLSLMYRHLQLSDTGCVLSETVAKVTNYIQEHLTEKISLKDLSEHFYISENHLNRLFRQSIGTTVIDYVIHKRIEYALTLLESGLSATETATKVGFGEYTNFYRAYKKITGHPPKMDVL